MAAKILVLAMVTAVFLQGCSASDTLPPDERIDGIVRILMHEPGHYTVLVQNATTSAITERRLPTGLERVGEVVYVPDVPSDQLMWLSTHFRISESSCCIRLADIVFHIHEVGDIEGAGWSHGKFGSGRTNVIE